MQAQLAEAVRLDQACPEAVFEQLRQAPLAEVTKGLGQYLCKESTVEAAMRTLARAATGRQTLNGDALKMICHFFAEKSQYKVLVATALSCLSMVVSDCQSRQRPMCERDVFETLLASPFFTVKAQTLPLGVRRHFFDTLSYMLNDSTVSLLSQEQLQSVLDLIDGESDPQLVLRTFQMHKILAAHAAPASFAPVAQDYFESLSSYFPIVFAKPPGCTVTKKDLREALAGAMEMEAYKDYCIPFLFGKLASPSFSVKDDTLETLRACVTRYGDASFQEFAPEVVTQMRNEVLKLAAYVDNDNNPSLAKQLELSCEVIGAVSRRYSESGAAKGVLLKLFEPVSEGLIACAASPASQVCASYATMMFHILTGGLASCLHVGTYTLTMLTLNVHDVVTPQTAILISGVCSGMMDSLSTVGEREPSAKDQLRQGLQQAVPMLVDCGKQAAAALERSDEDEESAPTATVGDATLSALCLAECVASIIKLSSALDPLMDDADATVLARSLATAAAAAAQADNASVVSAQVAKMFCSCLTLPNSRACATVLSEIVSTPAGGGASGRATLQFLRRVGSASSEAAELVLVQGLLADNSRWTSDPSVTSADVAEAALAILATAHVPHDDASVRRFLALRTLAEDATYFACACDVYSKASIGLCESRIAAMPSGVPPLEAAALLSSRVDVAISQPEVAETVARALVVECAPRGPMFAEAALNGVAALVRSGGGTVTVPTHPSGITPHQLDVAVLWGKLLGTHDEPKPEDVPSLPFGGEGGAAASCEEEAALLALAFFPRLASSSSSSLPSRTRSVLQWFINAGTAKAAVMEPFFWRGLAVLLANEVPDMVERCLPSLIPLCQRAAGHGEDALVSRVVMSAARHARSSVALSCAVLTSQALRTAVLSGTSDADLPTRCACLHFLGSLAGISAGQSDTKLSEAGKDARRDILVAAQRALSDHKRLVRQAAAKCREEWFKSK